MVEDSGLHNGPLGVPLDLKQALAWPPSVVLEAVELLLHLGLAHLSAAHPHLKVYLRAEVSSPSALLAMRRRNQERG